MLLAQVPPGFSVWKEEPLTLRDSEPEPDISVTRGDEASFAAKHPTTAELVVEVSVSSPALDRINAEMYAEAGVKEYWIILAASRTIELYRSPVNGRYREKSTLGIDTILEPSFLPGVRVAFRDSSPEH